VGADPGMAGCSYATEDDIKVKGIIQSFIHVARHLFTQKRLYREKKM